LHTHSRARRATSSYASRQKHGREPHVQHNMSATAAIRRLTRDLEAITQDPPEGASASPASEDNLFIWNASVFGPEGTAWEGRYRGGRDAKGAKAALARSGIAGVSVGSAAQEAVSLTMRDMCVLRGGALLVCLPGRNRVYV